MSQIWYTRCPVPTAVGIASHTGMLQAHMAHNGVEVVSLASLDTKEAQLSHYTHSVERSFRFGGYVPPLLAHAGGAQTRIVALGQVTRFAAILVSPNSELNGADDLRGKRIGVPKRLRDEIDWWRAEVLVGIHEALPLAGLEFEDVKLVDIPVPRAYADEATVGGQVHSLWGARSQFSLQREEITALLRGDVDAMFSESAVGAINSAAVGLRTLIDLGASEKRNRRDPLVLTFSASVLQNEPETVAEVLRALQAAAQWSRENEAEAKQIIANETGVPRDFVENAFSPRVNEELELSDDAELVESLTWKHDLLLKKGFLKKPLDLDQLIDFSVLRGIRNERT